MLLRQILNGEELSLKVLRGTKGAHWAPGYGKVLSSQRSAHRQHDPLRSLKTPVMPLAYHDAKIALVEGTHVDGLAQARSNVGQLGLNAMAHPSCRGPLDERSTAKPNGAGWPRTADTPSARSPVSIAANTTSDPLLSRPNLPATSTAWTILDFAVALGCRSFALLAYKTPLRPFLNWVAPSPITANTNISSVIGAVLFAISVAALMRLFGLQSSETRRTISSKQLLVPVAVFLASSGLDGVLRLRGGSAQAGEMLQLALTCVLLLLCRVFFRRQSSSHSRRDVATRNILIVGNDATGRDAGEYLVSLRYMGYRCKGFITLNETFEDGAETDNGDTLGSIKEVIALARSLFVDEIIFSRRPTTPDVLTHVLGQAQSMGIDVRLIPDVSEALKRHADVEYLGDLPTIILNLRPRRAISLVLKRSMDLTLGGMALAAASPLFVVIALIIKIQSPGPVLYRSKRVGYKGAAFTCYKFRTMVQNADALRSQFEHLNERHDILFKISKDPRVTRIGPFLRKYSLDELPQLLNVLRGNMSLVGPRPSIGSEVAQYQQAHLRRLDVIPGMTGLWQVEARHDPSFESYMNLDNKYVREWSVWLDLKIMVRTANAVLRGTGT